MAIQRDSTEILEKKIHVKGAWSRVGAGGASGAMLGAMLGTVAGAPGMMVGVLVGGAIGSIAGIAIDKQARLDNKTMIAIEAVEAEADREMESHRVRRDGKPPRV